LPEKQHKKNERYQYIVLPKRPLVEKMDSRWKNNRRKASVAEKGYCYDCKNIRYILDKAEAINLK